MGVVLQTALYWRFWTKSQALAMLAPPSSTSPNSPKSIDQSYIMLLSIIWNLIFSKVHADEIKGSANPAEFPRPQLLAWQYPISPSANEPSQTSPTLSHPPNVGFWNEYLIEFLHADRSSTSNSSTRNIVMSLKTGGTNTAENEGGATDC